MIVGLDLGDRHSHLCLLDSDSGEILEESKLTTSSKAFRRRLDSEWSLRITIEAGTHSPWVSRLLEECGHEVLVANPHRLRLIYGGKHKSDKLDAEKLARMTRLDPKLLYPLQHRGEEFQAHLGLIRSRQALISSRTQLVNHVRGSVKSFGARLPKCSTKSFANKVAEHIPEELKEALEPILQTIASLTEQIGGYDRKIEELAAERYPETGLLRQVQGVGTLTALTFVLTLEDPERFEKSRSVGAHLGLVPGTDSSGERAPEKGISKEGDGLLRGMLVSAAHYILGPFADDSDLRRHGEKIAAGGGKNAKKRAVIAVARKLSVLLHHLWLTGESYEPLYNSRRAGKEAA